MLDTKINCFFQVAPQNYCVDVEFPGNFDFILEPDAVEDILESVGAASFADCVHTESESQPKSATISDIDYDKLITSEETLTFICSDASYVQEKQSIHQTEEIKGKSKPDQMIKSRVKAPRGKELI